VVLPLVNVPLPLDVHEIVPLADEYPAGTVNESVAAHIVAELVAPAVATGRGLILSVNAVVAGGHTPPSPTDMVSVMGTGDVLSAVPKVYLGVAVVPLVNVPSPLVLQVIPVPGDPFVAVYPAGIL